MPIRPIDIQIAIQKTDQLAKDSNTNARVAIQQQDATSELQKQVVRNQKQVVSTSGSRYKRIDRDSQEKSQPDSKQRENKKKQNQAKGNNIDIIV